MSTPDRRENRNENEVCNYDTAEAEAQLGASDRAAVYALLAKQHGPEWPKTRAPLNTAIRSARKLG